MLFMQQPPLPNQPNINELLLANLGPMMRQLDRLEERTRSIVTREDLENLRKELITRDALEPQLSSLKAQIIRIESDRQEDKRDLAERIDKVEKEQLSRSERLWSKIGVGVAALAFLLALFQFLSQLSFH
jgi:hypothetical protein